MNDDEYALMFHDSAQRECKDITDAIVDEIQTSPLTPEKSGDMKRGYESRDTIEGAEVVQTLADYWKYVEYGTRYQQPQPHVRPAIEFVRGERNK